LTGIADSPNESNYNIPVIREGNYSDRRSDNSHSMPDERELHNEISQILEEKYSIEPGNIHIDGVKDWQPYQANDNYVLNITDILNSPSEIQGDAPCMQPQ
jgi:hypothetical protein